jgi:subtilisin family serine protease
MWDFGLRLGSPHLEGVAATGTPSNAAGDHATRVASVLLGRGASGDARALGVAPDATMCLYEAAFDVNRVAGLGSLMRAQGVSVVNVSRGKGDSDAYSLLDRSLDAEVRLGRRAELVFVFSAGNSGFPGDKSTLSKQPKNGILVGASTMADRAPESFPDSESVWATSSAGPTEDGRRLPTVCAPGAAVWVVTQPSPSALPGLAVDQGTSLAAPMVSGLLALVAQQRGELGSPPLSAAASRALLVACARPLAGKWGKRDEPLSPWHPAAGWGTVDARALLRHAADEVPPRQLYDQSAVFDKEGQQWRQRLQRVVQGAPVRVVLAWTDAPGPVALTESPASAVRNRLALEVSAGGTTCVDQRRIRQPGGAFAPDTLLVVDLPDGVGEFELVVSCEALFADAIEGARAPRQDFAVVVTNANET